MKREDDTTECERTERRDPPEASTPACIRRILVIDDDPDVGELLRCSLSQSDLEVYIATTGKRGLDLAKRIRPHLVIVDLGLPDVAGQEVLKILRRLPSLRTTPVMILTARKAVQSQIEQYDEGAVLYVVKPFEPRLIQAQAKSLLAFARPMFPDKDRLIRSDGMLLDIQAGLLKIGGRQLGPFTRKETEILRCLLENSPRVVLRETLHEALGQSPGMESHSLETLIYLIRRKMGAHADRIRAIPGRGYLVA